MTLLKPLNWRRGFARDIAVVILGVLIALAFNAWAESYSDRRLERTYLSRLIRDLEADSLLLQQYRANATRGEAGALFLVTVLESRNLASDTSVARSFSDATRGNLSAVHPPTIHEKKSTVNLRVLRNVRARDALLTYYSEVDRLQRSLETVMRRGREPLAEVGWDIQAFDPSLAYAISVDRGAGTKPNLPAPQSTRAAERFRVYPGARTAATRAVTYHRFIEPIVSDWELQLRLVRSELTRR
jgi:hypothetical protein